jgi:hypothetical protein
MPINIFWDNSEQSIVRQEFNGRWTSDEYVKSVFTMYEMMRTVPHKVHIIVDMTRTEGFTSRMLAAAPRFNENLPENRGLTVGINIPNYLISIVRVATRIYPQLGRYLHFANTVDEAYQIIEKYSARIRS